jgi:transcriptional regulator with XRE-family HTH domain
MSEDYLHRIGALIRDARKHRGWTQTDLAEQLGNQSVCGEPHRARATRT